MQVKLVLHAHAGPIPVLSFNSHILLVNSKLKMVSLSLFGRASKKISISCQFSYTRAILPGDNRSQSGRISSEIILFSEDRLRSFYSVVPSISQRATLFVVSSQWQNQTQGQHYIPRIFWICYFWFLAQTHLRVWRSACDSPQQGGNCSPQQNCRKNHQKFWCDHSQKSCNGKLITPEVKNPMILDIKTQCNLQCKTFILQFRNFSDAIYCHWSLYVLNL